MKRIIKTEHSGAKKGKGYWGHKKEAKVISRKRRRETSKFILKADIILVN